MVKLTADVILVLAKKSAKINSLPILHLIRYLHGWSRCNSYCTDGRESMSNQKSRQLMEAAGKSNYSVDDHKMMITRCVSAYMTILQYCKTVRL